VPITDTADYRGRRCPWERVLGRGDAEA
jgi:hypothetical protein